MPTFRRTPPPPIDSRQRHRQDYTQLNPEFRKNTDWSTDPIEAATDRAHDWVVNKFAPKNRYERDPYPRHGDRPNTPWSVDPIEAATDRMHDAVAGGIDRLRRKLDPRPVREEASRPRRIRRELTTRVRESEPEYRPQARPQLDRDPMQDLPQDYSTGDDFQAPPEDDFNMADMQGAGEQHMDGEEQQHIVMVTMADPDQPGSTVDRRIKVGGATDQEAVARAEAFYTKQGKNVQDSVYIKVFGAPPEDAGSMGEPAPTAVPARQPTPMPTDQFSF